MCGSFLISVDIMYSHMSRMSTFNTDINLLSYVIRLIIYYSQRKREKFQPAKLFFSQLQLSYKIKDMFWLFKSICEIVKFKMIKIYLLLLQIFITIVA